MNSWKTLILVSLALLGLPASFAVPSGRELSLSNLSPIDAHVHIQVDDPKFYQMLKSLNIRVISISYVDPHATEFQDVRSQHALARELSRKYPETFAWCSTFDPGHWENPGFSDETISALQDAFEHGSVGVKLYKTVGLEIQAKDGAYLMPDDPIFNAIFATLEKWNQPLFIHSAEPSASWQTLDPSSPHYDYYKAHPEWHMYAHPDRPSKKIILEARDHLLDQHRELRVIGCHLGSMEDNLGGLSLRLDRYANFAIDTAARMPDLMQKPHEEARSFFLKYQDRILYATDLGYLPRHGSEDSIRRWKSTYHRDWKYLATDHEFEVNGRRVRGLQLPEEVLRKVYRENALRWIPALRGRFEPTDR